MKIEESIMKNKKMFIIIIVLLIIFSFPFFTSSQDTKFQLEFSTGIVIKNPRDINLFPKNEINYFNFYYDQIYTTKSESGSLKEIRGINNFSTRLKYLLTNKLSISLGIQYLFKNQSSGYSVDYRSNLGWIDHLDYSTFQIKVQGLTPNIGLHLNQGLSKKINLEASVSAGILLGKIQFNRIVDESISEIYNDYIYTFYTNRKSLEMKGSGNGISLSSSLKMKYSLFKKAGIYLEGGYSYTKIGKISGTTIERSGDFEDTYSGDWIIVKETANTDWGSNEFIYPTNHPDLINYRDRDFKIDLSGFFISLGFFVDL